MLFRSSRMRARNSSRRAPASPTCAATMSFRRTLAAVHALSIASRTAAAALLIPTRRGLDGPAIPSPSISWLASIMTACVLVPPPSTPTTACCDRKRLAVSRSAARRSAFASLLPVLALSSEENTAFVDYSREGCLIMETKRFYYSDNPS